MDIGVAIRAERAIHAVRAHGGDSERARNLIEDEVLVVDSACHCTVGAAPVPAMDVIAAGRHVVHRASRSVGERSSVEVVDFPRNFRRRRGARVHAVFDAAGEVCLPATRRDELGVGNDLEMTAVDRALARDHIAVNGRGAIRVREFVVVHDGGIRVKGVFHLLVLAGVLAVIIGCRRIRLGVSSLQGSFERAFVSFIDDVLFSIAALLEVELFPCVLDSRRGVVSLAGVFRRDVNLALRDLAGIRLDARPVYAVCVRRCAGRQVRACESIVSGLPLDVVLDVLAGAGIRVAVLGLLYIPRRRMVDSIVYGVRIRLLDIVREELAVRNGGVVLHGLRAVVFLRDGVIPEAEVDLARRDLRRVLLPVAVLRLGDDVVGACIPARRAFESEVLVDDILVDDVEVFIALDILRGVFARRTRRRSEVACHIRVRQLDLAQIRRDDARVSGCRIFQAESAREHRVVGAAADEVVAVVDLVFGRLRVVDHHMHHALADVAFAFHIGVELVVRLLDFGIRRRARESKLVLDQLAVRSGFAFFLHGCRLVGRHGILGGDAVLVQELRTRRVDGEIHPAVGEHLFDLCLLLFIDNPCAGGVRLVLGEGDRAANLRRRPLGRQVCRAVVRLGDVRRTLLVHRQRAGRDHRRRMIWHLGTCTLQANLRAVAEGGGKSRVVVVDIRVRGFFQNRLDGLQALEGVDHVLVRRIAVAVLDVLVVVMRAERGGIRLVLAVHRVVQLDGTSSAQIEHEFELILEVGRIARAVRLQLAHRQAADLGVLRAVVCLAEGRSRPDPAHIARRDGKRLDLALVVDFSILDEVVLRRRVPSLQVAEGRLQVSVLHVAVDDRSVGVAVHMLILREDAVLVLRAVVGAHGAAVARRVEGRRVKLDVLAVLLAAEVEMILRRSVEDLGAGIIRLVRLRRGLDRQLLAIDIALAEHAVLVARDRIDCGQLRAVPIDERVVVARVVQCRIALEADGVGDILDDLAAEVVPVAASERAVRILCVRRTCGALHIMRVDVRHVEHCAVASDETRIVLERAVVVALGLLQDERLRQVGEDIGILRAVALVRALPHGIRAVVDLLHGVDRQEDVALLDLAQSLACGVPIVVARIVARRRAVRLGLRRDAGQIREVEVLVVQREAEGDVLLDARVLAAAAASRHILVDCAVDALRHGDLLRHAAFLIFHNDGVHESSGVARDVRRAVIDLGNRRTGEVDLELGVAVDHALRDPAAAMEAVIACRIRREVVAVVSKRIVRGSRAREPDPLVVDAPLVDIRIEIFAAIACQDADAARRTREAEDRRQTLDVLRAVILLVGIPCIDPERGLVDDVLIRRERLDHVRRTSRVVDDVVVLERMAVPIVAANGERVRDLLVLAGVGVLIGRRGLVRAVAPDEPRRRRFRCIAALAEGDVGVFVRRHCAADQYIRRPVVLLRDGIVGDPGIDLALFDVARRLQRLRVRAKSVEGIIARVHAPERRGVDDVAGVLRSGAGIDGRIRIAVDGSLAVGEAVPLERTRNLEVVRVRCRRAVVDLAQVRQLIERRRQKLLRDVARRVAVIRLVPQHVVAVGVRRVDRVVEFEIVQHLVRKLDIEENLLACPRILRAAAGSGLVLRLVHLFNIVVEVEELRSVRLLDIDVGDVALPCRGVVRAADLGVGVIRLRDRVEREDEVLVRDLERRDRARACHREVACCRISGKRVPIGVGEIVVARVRAREGEMRVFDVVLLRGLRRRDVRRDIDKLVRICSRRGRIGVQRHGVRGSGLIRQAVRQEQPAVAVLHRQSTVVALRDRRGGILAHGERRLLDGVRRRRDDVAARAVGSDERTRAVVERIVRRVRRIHLQRVFDRLRAFCGSLVDILRRRDVLAIGRTADRDDACILHDRAVRELVAERQERVAREHGAVPVDDVRLRVVRLRHIAVRERVDGTLRDRADALRARDRVRRAVILVACSLSRRAVEVGEAEVLQEAAVELDRVGDIARALVRRHIRIGIRSADQGVAVAWREVFPGTRPESDGDIADMAGRLCRIDILRGVVDLRDACEGEIEIACADLALLDLAIASLAVGDRVIAVRERILDARIPHETLVETRVALLRALRVRIDPLERRARSRVERRIILCKDCRRRRLVRIAVERCERVAPGRVRRIEFDGGRAVVLLDGVLERHADLARVDDPLARESRDGRAAVRPDEVVVVLIGVRYLQRIRHGLVRADIPVVVCTRGQVGAVAPDEIRHVDDSAAAGGLPVLIKHVQGTVVGLRDRRLDDGRQDFLRLDIAGLLRAGDDDAVVYIARNRVVAGAAAGSDSDAAEVVVARAAAREPDLVGDVQLVLAGEERARTIRIGMFVRIFLAQRAVGVGIRQEVHDRAVFQRDIQGRERCALQRSRVPVEGLRHIGEVHGEFLARRLVLSDRALAVRHRAGNRVVAVVERRRERVLDRVLLLRGQLRAVRAGVGVLRLGRLRRVRIVGADDVAVRPEGELHRVAGERARHRVIACILELLGVNIRRLIVGARHIAGRGKRQLLRRDLARARHLDRAARRLRAARRRVRKNVVRRGMSARKADRVLDVLAVILHCARQDVARAIDFVILFRMSALRLVDGSRRGDCCAVVRRAVLLDELVRRRRTIAEVRAELLVRIEDIRALVVLLVDIRLLQKVDIDRARRDLARALDRVIDVFLQRVESAAGKARDLVVGEVFCRPVRFERIGKADSAVRRVRGLVDILRAAAIRVDVVRLMIRRTDGKRDLVLVRRDDVRIRVGDCIRSHDLLRHAIDDDVVRAVVDLDRALVNGERRVVDPALVDVARVPERAACRRRRADVALVPLVLFLRHLRRLVCKRGAIELIAGSVDETIVVRLSGRAVGELDVLVGDVDVRAGVRARRGGSILARHVVRRDIVVVELQIFRYRARAAARIGARDHAREQQNIVRILRIDRALERRRAIIRLVVVLRRVRLDDDRLLADVGRQPGRKRQGAGRCVDILIVDGIAARELQFAADRQRLSIARICIGGGRGECRAAHVDCYIVALHEPVRRDACHSFFKRCGHIRRSVVLALHRTIRAKSCRDTALLDFDVRARDVVAMLAGVEDGDLARIAAAMVGVERDLLRIGCRRSGVADDLDVGNVADLRAIRFHELAERGVIGALIQTLALVRDSRVRDLLRIGVGGIAAVCAARLIELGIRILRLHRALHEGGEKRRRMSGEDAPRLVRAALVGDVPFVVRRCLHGVFVVCGSSQRSCCHLGRIGQHSLVVCVYLIGIVGAGQIVRCSQLCALRRVRILDEG